MSVPPLATLAPADGETVHDRVYESLRGQLLRGEIGAGARLTIRGAAQALGVSMMPVRGALQRLQTEGALVARGGKRVLGVPELSADGYREIRDIRVALEGMAAEQAALRVAPDEISVIRSYCQRMQDASERGDIAGYVSANWDFHRSVYAASRMPVLMTIIEGLWLRIGPYVEVMMSDRYTLLKSMPEHWAILEALARHDGAGARKGIAADIGEASTVLLAALEDRADARTGGRPRRRGASAGER